MVRDSDSELAFRLQMEEALAASLALRSPRPRAPSPIIARCGIAIVVEDDRRSLARQIVPANVRVDNRGPDVGKPSGKGSCKGGRNDEKPNGKGNIHVKATGVDGDDRKTNGKNRICIKPIGYDSGKPSLVTRLAKPSGEGSSKGPAASAKFKDNVVYRLYFKGLVSEEMAEGKKKAIVAGFGVAICDQVDNMLFEMKGPLSNTGMSRHETEIRALMRGLVEAVNLGIKRIAIYCDYYPIYQFVTGRWAPKQKKIAMLVDDVLRLRQQLTSGKPILVARNDIKFAFKLAREAIVSQISIPAESCKAKAAQKETCIICLEDTDAERMFSVDKCLHRYCFSCVKQYVEVKLLHGIVPKCPHVGCKSKLSIDSCGKLLTSKLVEMWKQRMKEDSIPVTEKVYCPYPRCSALMSRTELSESTKRAHVDPDKSGARKCVECHGLFCVNCKVPWHSKLSCTDYKKLHPNPPAEDAKLKSLANLNMWRQCIRCQHMIELSEGCYHMTCRCGYEFCYNCGAEWKKKQTTCPSCPLWNINNLLRANVARYDEDDYEDDYDDDYDYDYDIDDYLGLGPFVNDSDDDILFGRPRRWWLGVGQPQQDYEGTEAPYPFYNSDGIWDEEDWDYDDEEEHPAPDALSGTTIVHAAADGNLLPDYEDMYGEEEEEEDEECYGEDEEGFGREDEDIVEEVHGGEEEEEEDEECYGEDEEGFGREDEDIVEEVHGGGEEEEFADEEVYYEDEHYAGDNYGHSEDDYGQGGDDYGYGGDDFGYGTDSDWR